ncbi:MAG: class I SAM-dependent methyltransferase [Methanotrichaceae archaeon]|nr:class I SAM-dependent methyltransferase [Methanotrichaceae archaeon]
MAEECLEDLLTLPVTSELSASELDFDKCIDIDGLGIAFHILRPAKFWLLLTDKYSQVKVLKDADKFVCTKVFKSVKASEMDFLQALIEYYAISLSGELLCENCSVREEIVPMDERIERLKSVLKSLIPKGMSIMEICCGNGMATRALLGLGHNPWCIDLDRCDICQALKSKILDPRRSLVLDARYLDKFFSSDSFDVILGFMVGLINEANWFLWRDILLASSNLAEFMVFYTVYSQREAELIAETLGEVGWNGHVIDNRDAKGIYDQWIYLGKRLDEKVISTTERDQRR